MTTYLAYRGQHGSKDEIETFLPSISFGPLEIAEQYASTPNQRDSLVIKSRIFQVELSIDNPFINQPGDCYLDLEDLLAKLPGITADEIPIEPHPCMDYVIYQVWRLLDNHWFVNKLVEYGYDGAIYMSSGCGGGLVEYRLFSKKNITVINTYLKGDKNERISTKI